MREEHLQVLYQDKAILVLDKPAGLAVHPGPRTPHSLEALLPGLAARLGLHRRPVLMHRLDRDTSGCLLLALKPAAVRHLSRLFEARQVRKTYWAILDKVPDEDGGTINMPLAKVSSAQAGWRMAPDSRGKPAVTTWRVLDRTTGLVAFQPLTGRTHQLRVHANCLGTAITGDPVYGRPEERRTDQERAGAVQGMRLHARQLEMPMPDRSVLTVCAPLPPGWPAPPADIQAGDLAIFNNL